MPADSIEAQVIAFIAKSADVTPERVTLDSRLLHDLGFDGDDAVELFAGIHEQFGTDLTPLFERWSEHFGPEGMPFSAWLWLLPGSFVGGIIFANLDDVVGNIAAGVAAVVIAALIIFGSIWIGHKLGLFGNVAPITVGEVVQAVKAGAWPPDPSSP